MLISACDVEARCLRKSNLLWFILMTKGLITQLHYGTYHQAEVPFISALASDNQGGYQVCPYAGHVTWVIRWSHDVTWVIKWSHDLFFARKYQKVRMMISSVVRLTSNPR